MTIIEILWDFNTDLSESENRRDMLDIVVFMQEILNAWL